MIHKQNNIVNMLKFTQKKSNTNTYNKYNLEKNKTNTDNKINKIQRAYEKTKSKPVINLMLVNSQENKLKLKKISEINQKSKLNISKLNKIQESVLNAKKN